MDAIGSLVGGMQAAQLRVNVAADMLAKADLPVAPGHGTPAVATDPSTAVDVAEQLTTLMISADQHSATTAALRQALTTYQSAVDILMGS